MLRRMYTNLPNVLRGLMRGPSEAATFTSWVDFLQHGKSDFWNKHLTDPPCLGASVVCLTLCFGRGPSTAHHAGYEHWVPADQLNRDPCKGDGYFAEKLTLKDHAATACIFPIMRTYLWSDSGLTMRDVLKFAFEIRRGINCNSSDSTRWVHRHATMYDAIDAIKKKL
jgi:hypothetical protein